MCGRILKKVSSQKILVCITLICIGVEIVDYVMEHFFGILPCQMCHYERNVFIAAGGLSLFSLILIPSRFQRYALIGLGFVFMGGAVLAAYHVAIQQHWVSLPTFCMSNDFSAFESVETLREQLLKTPFVRCDQVTWSLFGLSLAAYNSLLSLILAIGCWGWVWAHKK